MAPDRPEQDILLQYRQRSLVVPLAMIPRANGAPEYPGGTQAGRAQKIPVAAPVMATDDIIWAALITLFHSCEPPTGFSGTTTESPGVR
jgi:hypothetical protein